jgi:hypothetical protein
MFLAHFGAVLYHTLIVRDGLLKRMAPWNVRSEGTKLGLVAAQERQNLGEQN